MKQKDLEQAFDKYGKIVEIKIRESRDRYAFIEFETYEAAEEAFSKYWAFNYLNLGGF